VLLGTLLVPAGFTGRRPFKESYEAPPEDETPSARRRREREEWRDPKAVLGVLPLARRDVERLRQVLGLQRRLLDMQSSPRAKRALLHRAPFAEALTWLEIHGHSPEIVEHWRGFIEASGPRDQPPIDLLGDGLKRRRRRRGADDRREQHRQCGIRNAEFGISSEFGMRSAEVVRNCAAFGGRFSSECCEWRNAEG
jgi:hypothetical protein